MKKGIQKSIAMQENMQKRKRTEKANMVTTIMPTEDQIRSRASEIYHERVQNGEYGTPESDWFDALESLKSV
jgi:hypothetical protein